MQSSQGHRSLAVICFFVYLQRSASITIDNYTTELVSYLPGALSGWYSMTNGFISTVHTNVEGTVDIVINLISKKSFEMPGSLFPLLKSQAAMITCVVIGFLFVISMWISGIVFCCSRCFGKCGGYTNRMDSCGEHFQHMVLILLLAGFTMMLMPASIILFAINDSLTESFIKAEKSVVSSIYDAELFLNNSHDEVRSAVINGVNEAVKEISADIDNVKNLVEEKMEKPLSSIGVSINQAKHILIGWSKISDALSSSYVSANAIKSDSRRIRNLMSSLKNKLTKLKQRCNHPSCESIDPSLVDPSHIPDLDITPLNTANEKLRKLNKQEFNNMFETIQNALKTIPDEISKQTKNSQEEAKNKLTKFADDALHDQFLKKLNKYTNLAREAITDGRSKAVKIMESSKPFDKTRWQIGLTVSFLILVVLLGLLFGLVIGAIGSYFPLIPGHFLKFGAGYILISVVYWIFIFSSILMLITIFLFTTGGITEVYICRPLFDEQFLILDKIMQALRGKAHIIPQGDEYKVARNLVPSYILSSCESNQTVYVALNLENLNLTSMLDYKKAINLEKNLKEFASIKPPTLNLPSTSKREFTELKNALEFSIPNDIYTKLDKDVPDLGDQRRILSDIPNSKDVLDDLTKIEKSLQQLTINKKELKRNLQNATKSARETKVALENLINGINNLNKNSQQMMPDIINKIVDSLSESILAQGDRLMNDIVQSLKTDIANCRIAWNIFNSARTVLCKYYILPLNGIWFGIGWSLFFFIPLVCICTKLSNNFLSIKEEKGFAKEQDIEFLEN